MGVEFVPGIVCRDTVLAVRIGARLFYRARAEPVYSDPERRILVG